MTFKQLDQFLRTEKWRAGIRQDSDMCGKYARCAYCDRFGNHPCARAYDMLMRKKEAGIATVSNWQFPEPDVKEKFGTVFANEEVVGDFVRVSAEREAHIMNLHPLQNEMKSLPAATEEIGESVKEVHNGSERTEVGYISLKSHNHRGTRILVIRRHAKNKSL